MSSSAPRIEYSEKYADETHEYRYVQCVFHATSLRHASCWNLLIRRSTKPVVSRVSLNSVGTIVRVTSLDVPKDTSPISAQQRMLCQLFRRLTSPTDLFKNPSHVILPKDIAKTLPKSRLLSESEWRSIGVQQSRGWQHYALHRPEPHILLFRRPLGTDPQSGCVDQELLAVAREEYKDQCGLLRNACAN